MTALPAKLPLERGMSTTCLLNCTVLFLRTVRTY